jgi:hypothetical protein
MFPFLPKGLRILPVLLATVWLGPSPAPGSMALRFAISAPKEGVQFDPYFGQSIAIEGGVTVVGMPQANYGPEHAGLVKIFDSATGARLHLLRCPTLKSYTNFGSAVAISGTRVVVGSSEEGAGTGYGGKAYVYDLDSATPTVPIATLANPQPVSGALFGAAVAISGTRVIVGAPGDDTGAAQAGRAYVYDLSGATPATPVAVLDNPSPNVDDGFGGAVAIAGSIAVVGAEEDDTVATDAGRAYVYDLAGATPAVPMLTFDDPTAVAGDSFGAAVAVAGTRVVVGAPSEDTGMPGAGSAYVYDLAGGTPSVPVTTLHNPTPWQGDSFGTALALAGGRLVVGTPGDDTSGGDAGAVYLYDLDSGTPTVPAFTLNNPGPRPQALGLSVAISGTKVAAGAPYDAFVPSTPTRGGAAYVFDVSSGTPGTPVAMLYDPEAADGNAFGSAMAVSGSLLVVGAPAVTNADRINSGAAYVYDLSNGTPTVPAFVLENPDPSGDYSSFGKAVAIFGSRVVIGTPLASLGATNSGAAYVYDLSSGTPTMPLFTLINPNPSVQSGFGAAVGISGTQVVVGVPSDDTGATNAGIAYVYEIGGGTPTVPVATLNNPDPTSSDNFGAAVAISGARVVVGAPRNDPGGGVGDAGSAYAFNLAGGSATPSATVIDNPDPDFDDRFGTAVAIAGTTAVIGAPGDDAGASSAGSAYVYDLGSGTPGVPIATLPNPQPAPVNYFGVSAAISGARVVVGACRNLAGAASIGSAYVFDVSSGSPGLPVATLENPDPVEGDNFGASVAIAGMTIAVGTPFKDAPQTDIGTAYVFDPSGPDTTTTVATSVVATGAFLHAGVNPGGYSTMAHFEYGTDPALAGASSTADTDLGGGTSSVFFDESLGGLQPQTVYYYRVVAMNSLGTSSGTILSFSTPSIGGGGGFSPAVATQDATVVTTQAATLNGSVLPNSQATTGHFEYGTDSGLAGANVTADVSLGSGGTATALTQILTGLLPGTTYYFRAVATNGSGTSRGTTLSFTTAQLIAITETGGLVPGDATAVFVEFGAPAVDEGRLGGAAIIKAPGRERETILYGGTGGSALARTGGAAPGGTTYTALGDPVFGGEAFGFAAKVRPAAVARGSGVSALLSQRTTAGGPQLLVMQGGLAPGPAGAQFRKLESFGLPRERAGLVFTARLRGSGVSKANDFGVFRETAAGGASDLILRAGTTLNLTAGGSREVRKLELMIPVPHASDQRRSFSPDGAVMAAATLADGSSALLRSMADGRVDAPVEKATAVPGLPGAEFERISAPATGNQGLFAFYASLRAASTGSSPPPRRAIFTNRGGSLRAVVRAGDPSPDIAFQRFASFGQPLMGRGGMIAFVAALTGQGVTPRNRRVIVQHRMDGTTAIVARQAAPAPDTGTGIVFQRFQSLVVTDTVDGKMIFTGTISGPTVTKLNRQGMWVVSSDGTVKLILRTDQVVNTGDGKMPRIRLFQSLEAKPASRGQGRSTDASGFVTAKVKLSDRRTGVLRIPLP